MKIIVLVLLYINSSYCGESKFIRLDKRSFEKPLVSQFEVYTSPNCVFCWKQYEEFLCAKEKIKSLKVNFYSKSGSVNSLRQWSKQKNFQFPFYLKPSDIDKTPTTFINLKNNKISQKIGVITCQEITNLLEQTF